MAEASFPVDLHNPGQVFACLGFIEAADVLLDHAEGGFDWSDATNVLFRLSADGEENPVAAVLEFLATAEPQQWAPLTYSDQPASKGKTLEQAKGIDDDAAASFDERGGDGEGIELCETFPAPRGDRMALPIRLRSGNRRLVDLGHWADGSTRNSFKLYAGNRSAGRIARAMLSGVHEKPKRHQHVGDLRAKGIRQLWQELREDLINRPLHVLTPMGGSFNFDPRGAWTAIDAGYSPNEQGHQVAASPVVEFLAIWGMENARPEVDEFEPRKVRYAAWGVPLPPGLARAALGRSLSTVPLKSFRFELALSGKNKVVTFAEMEASR
jgi:CRISPR-associated protein Csx14